MLRMSIEIEYRRWKDVYIPINKKISSMMHNFRQKYEMKNILERFMLRMANEADSGEVYVDLDSEHNIYQSLAMETLNKKLMSSRLIKALIFSIHQRIHFHLKNIKDTILEDVEVTKAEYTYRYREFRFPMNPLRMECFKDISDEHIVKMLIRYSLMFLGGQQWNLPFIWYKETISRFNISIEGCASPLNSQLMLCNDKAQFCSVFHDTDEPFGSLGSILDLPIDIIKNQVMFNNPPYVLEFMNRLMEVQTNWLEQVPVRIIMCVAAWEDAEYYQQALASRYLKYHERLKPNQHFYETIKRGEMTKIIAKFPSHIFIFSSHKKEIPKLVKSYLSITDGWLI